MDPQLKDFSFGGLDDLGGGEVGSQGPPGTKVQARAKPNKMNCSICRKTTKKVPGNRDGGVRCGICQFWWHPSCLNMDPGLLKWIVMGEELGNDCCWTCQHCQEAHIKTEQAMKVMSSRMKTMEQRVDKCEDKQDRMENKQELQVAKQDKVNNEFEERLKKLELNSGSGAIREIDDRMEKSYNLVVHRVPESTLEDPKERAAHDAFMIKVTMEKYLGIEGMDTDNKVRFIRRLGGRREEEEARPILLGLKFTADMELVLDRSWMLGRSNSKAAQAINIVRDLTVRQRQREADMVKEAYRKNLERNQEDQDLNLVFKVVGRKGEKREIKVPLRYGEEIDDLGRVASVDGRGFGNSRGASRPLGTGGNSEPLGSNRTSVQSKESGMVGVKGVEEANLGDIKGPEDNMELGDSKDTRNKKESGDGWQPAVGKRGRGSPSPDKVLKKARGGAVTEIRNRFQKMAEDLFKE